MIELDDLADDHKYDVTFVEMVKGFVVDVVVVAVVEVVAGKPFARNIPFTIVEF